MKMRLLAAASILLTVVLVASTSHAAPSCCDPKNGSTPVATFAPGQATSGPVRIAPPQARVASRQIVPAVRATGSNWGVPPIYQRQYASPSPVGLPKAPALPSCCSTANNRGSAPQRQYAAAKPVGLPNAPAAPSCCALPNNSGPAAGINPATQGQSAGCGCCGGTRGQASYSVFQPASGSVQFTANPPITGQQVYPAGQASCCAPNVPSNIQCGRNALQLTGFPGLW